MEIWIQSLRSQVRFVLQTMTVARTLEESYDLESDWLCSSGLAQHRLTKHPEIKQQNCESFIWGEEGRANGVAQSWEVCHLCHLPSLLDRPVCKSQRMGCPLPDPPGVVLHLSRFAPWLLAPFAPCSSYLSSLSSSYFLSSYDQPEGNLSWPSSIPFAWKQRSEERNTPCTRENPQSHWSGEKGNMGFPRASLLFLSDKCSSGQQTWLPEMLFWIFT